MTDQEKDEIVAEIFAGAKPYVFKILRSSLLTLVAVCLASAQGHANYSGWVIGSLVFLLSVINRYHWVAGMLILWLVTLYLVTPEMVAGLKAMRG